MVRKILYLQEDQIYHDHQVVPMQKGKTINTKHPTFNIPKNHTGMGIGMDHYVSH
jgi:hypothetical protein